MNAPAPLAGLPEPVQDAVKDGRTVGRTGNAPRGEPYPAINIAATHALVDELLRYVRSGRVPHWGKSVGKGGRVVFTFATFAGVTTAQTRLEQLIDWMRVSRKLGRSEARMECQPPCKSNKLHGQALKALAASGEIVKEGKYWIWAGDQ